MFREIQNLVHNLSGKTIRGGSWEGWEREEFQWGPRSLRCCLRGIVKNQEIGRGIGTRAVRWRVFIGYYDYAEGLKPNGKIWKGENSQLSSSSDSSSSVSSPCFVTLGGVTTCQLAAASATPSTTSWICGLRVFSPSQHFWMSFHSDSEIPIASEFPGLAGRKPDEMFNVCSVSLTPRNGCSPVRT